MYMIALIKTFIKKSFHTLLGVERSLTLFAIVKISRIQSSTSEQSLIRFCEVMRKRNPSWVIVDIGANIGITVATFARSCANPILAIEPTSFCIQVMRKVLDHYAISQRVRIEHCALGPKSGECTINTPIDHGVIMHGLSQVQSEQSSASMRSEVVALRTLDELLSSSDVAGIKIDVENFEYQVLLGSLSILENQHPPLLVELWNNQVRRDCFTLLAQYGYQGFVLRNGRFVDAHPDLPDDLDFAFIHHSELNLLD